MGREISPEISLIHTLELKLWHFKVFSYVCIWKPCICNVFCPHTTWGMEPREHISMMTFTQYSLAPRAPSFPNFRPKKSWGDNIQQGGGWLPIPASLKSTTCMCTIKGITHTMYVILIIRGTYTMLHVHGQIYGQNGSHFVLVHPDFSLEENGTWALTARSQQLNGKYIIIAYALVICFIQLWTRMAWTCYRWAALLNS